MKVSIVTTLYHSEIYINEFYRRAAATVKQITDNYEIIFVNDGSPDNSLQIALALSRLDSNVMVVELSRNFGHHKAMMTGLKYATGDYIFLIDSDLEEEPEWLLMFYESITKQQCDVVYGIQANRRGGLIDRWGGTLFYKLFNVISGTRIPENLVTARLMTHQYVSELLRHEEYELMIAGLWVLTGFDQRPLEVVKHTHSATTYTLSRKLSLIVNAVTSFSNKPLIWIFYLGLLILFISLFFSGYMVINWLFFFKPISGWTSIIVSIWLLGGLVISLIGIISIYLSKIFIETKKRPYVIVKKVHTIAKNL